MLLTNEPVFTYWEGPNNFIANSCIKSITNIFGSRHIHITHETVENYISIPDFIKKFNHIGVRTDFIRTALIYRFGGWWFDSDIFLVSNPTPLVEGTGSVIWTENKKDISGRPNICNAVLFSQPGNLLYLQLLEKFKQLKSEPASWTYGQSLFAEEINSGAYDQRILGHNNFYPVLAEDWPLLWTKHHNNISIEYGIHLYMSKIRRMKHDFLLANKILGFTSLEDAILQFPSCIIVKLFSELVIIE